MNGVCKTLEFWHRLFPGSRTHPMITETAHLEDGTTITEMKPW